MMGVYLRGLHFYPGRPSLTLQGLAYLWLAVMHEVGVVLQWRDRLGVAIGSPAVRLNVHHSGGAAAAVASVRRRRAHDVRLPPWLAARVQQDEVQGVIGRMKLTDAH